MGGMHIADGLRHARPAPAHCSRGEPARPCARRHLGRSSVARRHAARATEEKTQETPTAPEAATNQSDAPGPDTAPAGQAANGAGSKAAEEGGDFIPIFKPEELPKGYRREATVGGVDLMLFWYKNSIRAIEARSPAEGAYSEGFMNSVFTQSNEIACPGTGTLFNLDTGEITEWYPNNPVLRAITPKDTCRRLQIFPVKLTQQAIMVDVSGAVALSTQDRGGFNTSAEANNVFAVQPRVYLQGSSPYNDELSQKDGWVAPPNELADPSTVLISIFAVACVGAAGTAGALYYESTVALAVLWALIGVVVIKSVVDYLKKDGSLD